MCAALAYVVGILLAQGIAYTPWLWVAAAALPLAGILARRQRRAAWALVLVGMAFLGLARGSLALRPPDLPPVGAWRVEGTVTGTPKDNGQATMFFLRDVRVQPAGDAPWQAIDGGLYVYSPNGEAPLSLAHGERVRTAGTSYLPTGRRNPGGFDQRMWLAQNGTHVRLYATAPPETLAPASWSLRGWALGINRALGARMDALFGPASPVIRAMLLGDTDGISDAWNGWMRTSGIAHLLAVSGLHVGLWFVLLEGLLRPVPASPRARWVLLAALLGVYALVTGLKASVLRAAIMLLVMQGGHVARRKPEPLTTLGVAALLILLARPLDLFAAGFQLSFAAVLGIALLRPVLVRALPKRPAWLWQSLGITAAAQVGILPPATRWFGTAPVLGVLANLVAVPLAGLLIPVAALILLAKGTASLPLASVRIGAFAWWTAAAFGLTMLLCSTAVVWRWRRRLAAMAALWIAAAGIGVASGALVPKYTQLDVGQALSGVLEVGRTTVVYDCGNENSDLTEYLM